MCASTATVRSCDSDGGNIHLRTRRNLLTTLAAITLLVAGCQKGPVKEAISHKDDYKQAYIYGFPMLMNYAVMYEYAIDKNSSQYKAPFNHIYNEDRVFTPKDTAVVTPNQKANWLPAPNDPIYVVMRLYSSKTEAPSILPPGKRYLAATRHSNRTVVVAAPKQT